MERNLPKVEVVEQFSHPGYVIQRQHKLTLQVTEPVGQFREIVVREIELVQLEAPIRWVQIEQGRWPIKVIEDFRIRHTLDLNPLESPMCIFNELGKSLQVETGSLHDQAMVMSVPHQSRERVLLEVEETSRALDVGQRLRVFRLKEREPLAAHEDELEIPEEFLVVQLADPEEVHEFTVKIIQDLDRRRLLMEENLGASGERLDIRLVCWKDLYDLIGNAVLPSDVGQWADHASVDEAEKAGAFC